MLRNIDAGHSMRPPTRPPLRQLPAAVVQVLRDQDAHAVERERAVQSLRTSELDQGRSCRRVSCIDAALPNEMLCPCLAGGMIMFA